MSDNSNLMTTYTGRWINPLDPDPAAIDILDIAHHLSLECRYHGACSFLYSVAQHCVLGLDFISQENRLAFLLHDSPEAYLDDIVKGVKVQIPQYVEAENKLQGIIYKKYGVKGYDRREIKRIDYALMNTEAHALLTNTDKFCFPELPLDIAISYWEPEFAEEMFLHAFDKYCTCYSL